MKSSPDQDHDPRYDAHLIGKQAETAPLQAQVLQNAIFNSAMFSKIATDRNGVIQIFNVGAAHMLGYTADDVLNKLTPADIADPWELIARAMALSDEFDTQIKPGFEALVFKASRGIEDIYELTYIRKDGSRLPALVSVTALRDASDIIIGYLLIGTDNTARKNTEIARQEMNAELGRAKVLAEAANHAKSEFLSNMSHELRSPLNAILGFAQLLESSNPPATASQQESIGQILQAGWYLLALINEILDLALIESGKLSLSTECVSLTECMNTCQGMSEPQATKLGIHVEFPRMAHPHFVKADRMRLKQVMINLLSNAIKYNRPNGRVDVVCEVVSRTRTRVSVHDTGQGLSAEKIAGLFQPFNRLGQETGSQEGTGIGLVVSKRLVELMGGSIGVQSIEGRGSVFWIELDAAVAPELIPESGHEAIVDSPTLSPSDTIHTVLCVEDNPANLILLEKLLNRRADIRLLTARDGKSGIDLARAAKPDAILMDINLPGINGLNAMKILRDDPTTRHIPVLALSANAMARDIELGLQAGFFRYLTKPIRVGEFMLALNDALEFAHTTPARPRPEENE